MRNIATDPSAHAVVRATIDMAHALGKSVVAEGVEYAAQLALLRKMNCDFVQGYYISAPLTAPALVELLHMRSPTNAVPD